MVSIVCEQHRDGIPDPDITIVHPLEGESAAQALKRKLEGAIYHGWKVERTRKTSFHVSKNYLDGDGTRDRPHRKDRYFSIR